MLAALFTAVVAARQILLHIVPGTGSYGSALFGLHAYTWSFLISVGIILSTALSLKFEDQFKSPEWILKPPVMHWLVPVIFFFSIGLGILNVITTFLECGFGPCPDNPTSYMIKVSFIY